MCGIFGVVGRLTTFDHRQMNRNLGLLKHRGPDASGVWVSKCNQALFGHVRLSIVDLSDSARQPMIRRDGELALVFNGEIYNFKSIREELSSAGFSFDSKSDTEVILAAYEAWGPSCLERFNGMFAFAIFDTRLDNGNGGVFFARDRAGEKPFYLNFYNDKLYFGSELKAIPGKRNVDGLALNSYLALGYVPADECLFSGVKKLPPAHCGIFLPRTGDLHTWRYWTLPHRNSPLSSDVKVHCEEVEALIESSVRQRIEADVPVGVLLSGGLDSSLIAAAAARVSSGPIDTFTIALPGSRLDESKYAQKVASFLGANHNVLELERPSLNVLDDVAPMIDEPIGDSSILPAFLVFGLARDKVKVALGGDGGDELFGGYSDYTSSLSDLKKFGWLPDKFFRVMARIAAELPAGVKGRNRLSALRGGPLEQMIWGSPYFDLELRQKIFNKPTWEGLSELQADPERRLLSYFNTGTSPVDKMTRAHFSSILPDDFLVKVDRASMMHGLEVRTPMLDHRLIEYCFAQIPDKFKVKNSESRILQRLIGKRWLPQDLDIERKQGFSIPIDGWLRAEGRAGLLARMDGLPDEINMDEVRRLIDGLLLGRTNGGRLFALIMLAIANRNSNK